ncbi:hypothetical protein Z949_159 [Sulfitobacter guttiformis KCTC 32187]|nr:hypothetical protein Z949_159 [Sulfitobacter guttiformis KCTC 32187]
MAISLLRPFKKGGFWGSDASAAKGRFEPKLPSGTEKSFAGASLQACVISDAT